jgi:hypothetical protein
VTVADEGPGIVDEEKERVFDRFYQTEAGRAVRSRGVGLGLAICREIVLDHGGSIWVADNEPRGSVFQVLLPGAVRVGNTSSCSRARGRRRTGLTVARRSRVVALAMLACARRRSLTATGRPINGRRRPVAADSSLRNDASTVSSRGDVRHAGGHTIMTREGARSFVVAAVALSAMPHRVDATASPVDRGVLRAQRVCRSQPRTSKRGSALVENTGPARAVDSMVVQNDSVRAVITRLESDRRDRDEQLRVLRLELQRLKEIDLKPRRPPEKPTP